MSAFQDRLAARPPVPHTKSCHTCYPPEGSLMRGVLWGMAFALFFWGGVLLLLAPSWLDAFIRWLLS